LEIPEISIPEVVSIPEMDSIPEISIPDEDIPEVVVNTKVIDMGKASEDKQVVR